MTEFELIACLTRSLPLHAATIVGPGDDCAVLDLGLPDQWVLFKTDAVVADIHFDATARPEQIGHKALGRCLSDIAAMAGTPIAALVTLALRRDFDPHWVQAIYAGMKALAERYQVGIVGGETTRHPGGTLISVSLLGTVVKTKCVLRSGARPDDALFVTGELGGSLAGKHLNFEPRLNEARWLADHFPVHAMIDISDGLAGDLRHLLRIGGLGAELDARSIPISAAARSLHPEKSAIKSPLNAALTDGEDFELLFALASGEAIPLLNAWERQFPALSLSRIGTVTAVPGLRLGDPNGMIEVTEQGYVHFA